MSAKDLSNVKKKYTRVPPDGGWGFFIVLAVAINISTSTAFTSSYELLLKELLKEIGSSSTNISLMRGLSAICTATAGFLTGPLLSIISFRMLTLAAVILFNIGVICIMFVKSAFTFHICHGILQGLGFGLIYNLSCTILVDYFLKKRLMAIGLVHSAVAIISMIAPLFVKWSLEKYGFRDTILLMSALIMHNFIAVALMQPVQWHLKRVEVSDKNNEKLLQDKKQKEEFCTVPIIKVTNTDGNLSNRNNEKFYKTGEENGGINFRKIKDLLIDKSLCEKFLKSCVCAGPALALFADTTYFIILPHALLIAGWLQEDVTLTQHLYGFGDLATRVLFTLLSNWVHKLGSQELYILGVTLGLVSRLGTLWSKSFIAKMVYIPLVGASHCAVTILIPLLVADAVRPDKFTSALGMLMMVTGLVSVVLGPAISAVRELSESYGPVFYLIASCLAIIVLFWSIELCYKRNKHKRLQRREYLRQKKLLNK
uniref:SFRICE_004034 n=1 Tax=Spodoptera frugiperda TaxID=7108 RepID=A0A2H1VVR9_SPOFR